MSSTRYTPNTFQYNGRVALALVPCLGVAAMLGGQPVTACLAVGAMVSYIMDIMQYREGAFTCSWLTLAFANVAFVYSRVVHVDTNPFILMPLVFAMCSLTGLIGMWISLQFKWIQMQYPPVTIIFERAVLTASLPTAAMMHSLGLASLVDASDVPYYLAILLGLMYYGMGRPLPSSFHSPRAGPAGIGGGKSQAKASDGVVDEGTVQGKLDGFCMALLTVGLPAGMYMSIHWVVLFRHAVHMYSLVLLFFLPLLYVALVPQGLWWLPGAPKQYSFFHKLVIGIALIGALIGFEGRVVFFAFGQYIQLPPPWNWVMVTLGLFGFALVTVAHMAGAIGVTVDATIAGTFLLLCTTAGSLAVGVPMMWLPAPLVAAGGLALFYDSQSLREYIIFCIGAFLTCVWFMQQHFWFLDIFIGPLHLHVLCKLVLAASVPALLVPGLVHANSSPGAISALLILQASVICLLEEKLYGSSHEDFSGEVMYPGYLVMLTSAAGVLAARRLQGHVTKVAYWVLHSVYAAKLFMLVLPEEGLVLPSIILFGSAAAPLFLHTSSAPGRRRLRIANWQGVVHALSVLVAVALARFALFDVVQFLLAARPTEGILLGSLLLLLAGALSPLVMRCYSHNQTLTRSLAILAMAGVLLVLLQPPMPLRGGARCPKLPLSLCPRLWDERHIPMHSSEDVEVWGRGLARKEHWPRWMLVAASVLSMCASMLGGPMARSIFGRVVLSLTAGFLIGSYVALEMVPGQMVLQILMLVACMIVVCFVVGVQIPGAARGSGFLPFLGFVWLVVFCLTLLLQTELSPPEPAPEMKRMFPDSTSEVELEIFLATRASLLGVFAAHSLLMAFVLKLRSTAALKQQDAKLSHEGHDAALYTSQQGLSACDLFCGVVPSKLFARYSGMLHMTGGGEVALQRLHREGLGWVPTAGNIFTILTFVLAVSVNVYLTGGEAEAIFFLAPLLLLLSQDPIFFQELTEGHRYFPVAAVTTAYLTVTVIANALTSMGPATFGHSFFHFTLPGFYMTLGFQLGLAALTLPSHIIFLNYLWTLNAKPGAALLIVGPLNLIPLLLASYATKYLALLGLLMSLTQFFSMKHHRQQSMKVI